MNEIIELIKSIKLIDYEFFKKDSIMSFFSNQFIPYTIYYIFAMVLCRNESPFLIYINLCIITLFVYFIHRVFHYVPYKINLHLKYHHTHNKDEIKNGNYKLIRMRNSIIETTVNIGFFVALYLIKKYFKLHFIKNILIFYVGFIYVTVHNINYSIYHLSKVHVNHHRYKDCNFGPDVYDHLFGTTKDKEFEDMSHMLLNNVIGFILSVILFRPSIFY